MESRRLVLYTRAVASASRTSVQRAMSSGQQSQQFCVRWNSHLGSIGAAFPQVSQIKKKNSQDPLELFSVLKPLISNTASKLITKHRKMHFTHHTKTNVSMCACVCVFVSSGSRVRVWVQLQRPSRRSRACYLTNLPV